MYFTSKPHIYPKYHISLVRMTEYLTLINIKYYIRKLLGLLAEVLKYCTSTRDVACIPPPLVVAVITELGFPLPTEFTAVRKS